ADTSTARLIADMLARVVCGMDVMSTPKIWAALVGAARNLGRSGIASMAISAVDVAMWDLKARLLAVPLVSLLGAARDAAPLYRSGGFHSDSEESLRSERA